MKIDLDAIIDRYLVTEPTVTVELPGGEELTFKTWGRKADLDAFEKSVMLWYAPLRDGVADHHPLHGLIPQTGAEALEAYAVHDRSLGGRAPDGNGGWIELEKITLEHALRMLRAPWLLEMITKQIEAASKTMQSIAMGKLIEESKKNSTADDSNDSPSLAPLEPSESTQTN